MGIVFLAATAAEVLRDLEHAFLEDMLNECADSAAPSHEDQIRLEGGFYPRQSGIRDAEDRFADSAPDWD